MMTTPDHSARAHALLSASGAHRWMRCTPSALLESRMPDKGSAFAEEGTLAHELCEMYLRGKETEADAYERFDPEMHEHARGYADYVAEKTRTEDIVAVEEKVDFSSWVPEGFGTCDCLLIGTDRLTVIDFKYGKGVEVSAEANPQLMLYALGALDLYSIASDFKTVEICIYQPRLGNISEWTISTKDLYEWAENVLKPAAELAIQGKGERKAGDHCRFCRYAPLCETLADRALEDFDVEIADLSPERIGDILSREKMITAWLKSVKDYAFNRLMDDPESIPGYKIVEGRSVRQYTDTAAIAGVLKAEGFAEDVIYNRKLLGITEMTKLLGKKRFDSLLGEYIEKPAGAPTIAPEDDKRPRIDPRSIADDFD